MPGWWLGWSAARWSARLWRQARGGVSVGAPDTKHELGVTAPPSMLWHRPRVPPKLGPMAPTGGVPTWQYLRVGQQTQGTPGQTGNEDSALARFAGSTGRRRCGSRRHPAL